MTAFFYTKPTTTILLLGLYLLGTATGAVAQLPIVDRDGNGLIEINNLDDLAAIRTSLDGKSLHGSSVGCPASGCYGYELTRNLDFDTNGDGKVDNNDWSGGNSWSPIGTDKPFSAVFDGNGHAIRNLKLLRFSYLDAQGFFGQLENADIFNLRLEKVRVSMSTTEGDRRYSIGALAGVARSSSIRFVYVDSVDFRANLPNSNIGGLVGIAHSTYFHDVRYSGDITHPHGVSSNMPSFSSLGGIVGDMRDSSMWNAIARGSILGPRVGGLVGRMSNSTIQQSFSNSQLRAKHVGGLAYEAEYSLLGAHKVVSPDSYGIYNSYALGSIVVENGHIAGGLIGYINLISNVKASIVNSYSKNVIRRASDNVAWTNLIERVDPDLSIRNSYWVTDPEGVALPHLYSMPTAGGYSLQDLQCAAPGENNGCNYPDLLNTWSGIWDFGTTTQLPALKTATMYPWISSDTPNATGDHESFSNLKKTYPDKMCDNPIWLAAKVKNTAYRFSAPQAYDQPLATFNPREGLLCLHRDQANGTCEDFQVRYLCHETSVGGTVRWTNWINNSRPGAVSEGAGAIGDDERLYVNVCPVGTPVRIAARSVSNSYRAGPPQKLSRLGLTKGLACLNADNPGGCKDYEMQFQCPTLGDR